MFWTPRWIASHLFAASLIVAFIAAGFWQVNRLGERQDTNVRIEARQNGDPVGPASLVGVPPDDAEFRRVQARGTWDQAREILIANRSDEGSPGFWAWTVFRTDDGSELLVNRGFVSRSIVLGIEGAIPFADTVAGEGPTIVEGLLRQGLDGGGRLSSDGTQLSRPDSPLAVDTLDVNTLLDPILYLELDAQEPPQRSDFPRVLPPPDLGEGPHRSYAFQWFTFATIGVIGYALVLRRIKRGDATKGDVPLAAQPAEG